MSYRVTLSLPDIEGDNPVMAVEAFAHAARQWEQWQYTVLDEETGLRYDVDMQTADEGGVIYPTLREGGVRYGDEAERLNAHHGSISDTLKCEQCVPTEKLVAELAARGVAPVERGHDYEGDTR